MPTSTLKELYLHRDLLLAWTGRTVRARYQQSLLGGLWAILQPAATALIFTVIFTIFIPLDTGEIPYVVFSYTAMVPWTLFSAGITDMTDTLVTNMNLVTKIYFPRDVLVVAALLSRLVDFTIALSVLILLMLFYQMPMTISWFLLPVILAIQLALMLGIGLAGAALNVFYRDIRHLVSLGLQMWLYATPIIYPITVVPESIRPLYFLNPMAGAVEGYRAILLRGELPGSYLYISTIVALLVLVCGYWFFKRVEFRFADII